MWNAPGPYPFASLFHPYPPALPYAPLPARPPVCTLTRPPPLLHLPATLDPSSQQEYKEQGDKKFDATFYLNNFRL
jgi:hypothetical protein